MNPTSSPKAVLASPQQQKRELKDAVRRHQTDSSTDFATHGRGEKSPSNTQSGNIETDKESEDLSGLLDTWGRPVVENKEDEGDVADSKDTETDEVRLKWRQKQIDLGKGTEGYQRYLELVRKENRKKKFRTSYHPVTPDKHFKCSKRRFQGQISKWRKLLHNWDSQENNFENKGIHVRRHEFYQGHHTWTRRSQGHTQPRKKQSPPSPIVHRNILTAPNRSRKPLFKTNRHMGCSGGDAGDRVWPVTNSSEECGENGGGGHACAAMDVEMEDE